MSEKTVRVDLSFVYEDFDDRMVHGFLFDVTRSQAERIQAFASGPHGLEHMDVFCGPVPGGDAPGSDLTARSVLEDLLGAVPSADLPDLDDADEEVSQDDPAARAYVHAVNLAEELDDLLAGPGADLADLEKYGILAVFRSGGSHRTAFLSADPLQAEEFASSLESMLSDSVVGVALVSPQDGLASFLSWADRQEYQNARAVPDEIAGLVNLLRGIASENVPAPPRPVKP